MIIITNTQNKLYTIKFSHHPMTNLQPVPEQKSQNLEIADFMNFVKIPKKTVNPEKFELPAKKEFELNEK